MEIKESEAGESASDFCYYNKSVPADKMHGTLLLKLNL